MKKLLSIILLLGLLSLNVSPALAVWRGRAPLTLTLANHTSADWAPYIAQAAAEWSQSTVLDITVSTGNSKWSVYNGLYRSNYPAAWTTLSYGGGGYTQTANTSLNDTYLSTFTSDQKLHTICAEIGNAISNNEGCRDRVTGEWFTEPTAEDFAELVQIYGN